jgi:hypothetical protein
MLRSEMKRAVLHFFFAFLLLSAQLSALAHSVWHLHDYLPAHGKQDRGGVVREQGGDGLPSPQAELCVFHAALGSLFAGGCAKQPALAPADVFGWVASSPAVWRVARPATTPPSRAPPVLL